MQRKGRKVRSMRGEEVDFDLMEIKKQMADQPKSMEVKAREDFIEQRLRRRAKRRIQQTVEQANVEVDAKVEDAPEQEKPIVEKKGFGALPPNEEVIGKTAEELAEDDAPPKKTTRRIKKKEEE